MTYHNKTREELIAELQLIQDKYNTLKELYEKEKAGSPEEQLTAFKEKQWLDYIFESTRTGIDIIDEDYNLLLSIRDGKKCTVVLAVKMLRIFHGTGRAMPQLCYSSSLEPRK